MLLICGSSYSKGNQNFSYGGLRDSVIVSYDDIRTANAKMLELEYEKDINEKLRQVILNDSIIITSLNFELDTTNKKYKKAKLREHIAEGVSILSIIGLIISLCK